MKVIIAGSRDIDDYTVIDRAISRSNFEITEVVSGGCRGVAMLGEQWAAEYGVPIQRFPADWETHGDKAGPMRNALMAKYADALIAVSDGGRGTMDMIQKARKACIGIFIAPVIDGIYSTSVEMATLIIELKMEATRLEHKNEKLRKIAKKYKQLYLRSKRQ